jgi:hypothetical protein
MIPLAEKHREIPGDSWCVVPITAYGKTPPYEHESTTNRRCVAAESAYGEASPYERESNA